MKIQGIYCI